MRFFRFSYQFSPKYWSTFLTLLALTFFMMLGFWQLQRAQEKNQVLAQFRHLKNQPAIQWHEGDRAPSPYASVQLNGRYTQDIFLFDNQHRQHHFGYNVISVLAISPTQVVLVDRGWVQGDVTRRMLPDVTTPVALQIVRGRVYYPSKRTFLLGDAIETRGANISLVEVLDTKLISQFLHKSVYPFIIRLGKNEAHGFLRQWSLVSMPPARHIVYAVQWFAFAFLAFILYIGLNLKKIS